MSSTKKESKVYKRTLAGGLFAFIIATTCCWLPAFAILIGGASSLAALNSALTKYSGLFMAMGIMLLAIGLYQYRKRHMNKTKELILESTITCPICAHQKTETMPTNACKYFYACEKCGSMSKPKKGDCCVYCSYGDVACPPIQQGEDCC